MTYGYVRFQVSVGLVAVSRAAFADLDAEGGACMAEEVAWTSANVSESM